LKIITVRQILVLHEFEIIKHGGSSGVRDVGMLKSATGRPFATFSGEDLYLGIFMKCAALVQSIVKNHPFVDGNKRTALVSALVFLKLNGYVFEINQKETVKFIS
jgi:death-on-curing protein